MGSGHLTEPTAWVKRGFGAILGAHGVFGVSFVRVMLADGPRFLVFRSFTLTKEKGWQLDVELGFKRRMPVMDSQNFHSTFRKLGPLERKHR